MGRDDEKRPDPMTQGKGRVDEVDQSKGIFRLDGPHNVRRLTKNVARICVTEVKPGLRPRLARRPS